MKNVFRLFLVLFIGYLSLILSTDVFAVTKEQGQRLLQKVEEGLRDQENKLASKNLIRKIEKQSEDDLYESVISAPGSAINAYVISVLIKNFPNLAKQLFDIAITPGFADDSLYVYYIEVVGRKGDFPEVKRAFENAKKRNLATKRVYSMYFMEAGNLGYFDEVEMAFHEAERQKLFDHYCYSIYIKEAGKAHCFKEARNAFMEAITLGLGDARTYSSYIELAGDVGDFVEVQMAFDDVRNLRLDNNVTYSSYMIAAMNTGHFAEAEDAFHEAVDQEKLDIINCIIFIDILIRQGQIKRAIRVFLKIYPEYIDYPAENRYDLRNVSFGVAYVATHLFIERARICDEIVILVGSGSRSKDEEVVRRAIDLFITLSDGAVLARPGSDPGILILRLRSQYNPI